jgi:hypothetical protein
VRGKLLIYFSISVIYISLFVVIYYDYNKHIESLRNDIYNRIILFDSISIQREKIDKEFVEFAKCIKNQKDSLIKKRLDSICFFDEERRIMTDSISFLKDKISKLCNCPISKKNNRIDTFFYKINTSPFDNNTDTVIHNIFVPDSILNNYVYISIHELLINKTENDLFLSNFIFLPTKKKDYVQLDYSYDIGDILKNNDSLNVNLSIHYYYIKYNILNNFSLIYEFSKSTKNNKNYRAEEKIIKTLFFNIKKE